MLGTSAHKYAALLSRGELPGSAIQPISEVFLCASIGSHNGDRDTDLIV